jgi:hypothetical protein
MALGESVVRLLRFPDLRSTSTWIDAFVMVALLNPRNLNDLSNNSFGGTWGSML